MNVRTNSDKLVSVSVMGQIASPGFPGLPAEPYRLDASGKPFLLPTYGGIVYNVSIGDSAYGWLADTIHPGVSISLKDDTGNRGLNLFACVGNVAMVMTGDAKGTKGVVTGKSGRFSEQVIIHFDKEARKKMAIGDKINIRSIGVGMDLLDHPDIKLKSCSPDILENLEVTTGSDGKLNVPVVGVVPAHLLGSGAGLTSEGGSLHIQTADKEALKDAKLDGLKLGDVVALMDYDSSWNHGYLRGAIGIGVVGQGDSPRAGHGPGITLLMTSPQTGINPQVTPGVNLKSVFNLAD
ncbi:MAG: DUF4438 domain-containing protein [Chloroflexi bacterium]|nr:DUF4438 domain-containing protein [Chloroflexota bacterium]MCC6895302.1 DUF4438 domain-containing protein [Anaerolineae bacterium]